MDQLNSSIAEVPKANNPTIVIFGDQSCGKTSVLKRLIRGLPLPIKSTRSTYAPFEIRMIPSEEPLRKISLRYIEDKNHKPTTPREVEFANITGLEAEEVEEKLYEAQRYAQNPSITDVENTRLPPDSNELDHTTKNTVCLTISGPHSLFMIDLPGVVRNDANHENFVLSLVKEYIKKESAILVPIFHSTSDILTQCAYRLAREADPSGQRTVGVLTKMDRIVDYPSDDEKHHELATLVKGEGVLVNSAYVIRNPSDARSEILEDPEEMEKVTIETLKQHSRELSRHPKSLFD
ncbi:hypothetical protein RclHR1_02560013 [Rhizophagus clarus]|uniref:Dynamin GTPase domain-containing protein n=1 Tax=Rhizophagus clarus TaxID=94130 RepID=A0A2Z6QZF5_9GLOM|nr:hypothetical protein RclHR1_02560013 [Rhizophagus clarus]GES77113.1 hypothetical protein RCL_jg25997.t1 [Rhizophagus clarus]